MPKRNPAGGRNGPRVKNLKLGQQHALDAIEVSPHQLVEKFLGHGVFTNDM